MSTVPQPLGVNPVAVNKYINISTNAGCSHTQPETILLPLV